MSIEEYGRLHDGSPTNCACCGGATWVQVYGVYLCKDCDENKRVAWFHVGDVLHMALEIGAVWLS